MMKPEKREDIIALAMAIGGMCNGHEATTVLAAIECVQIDVLRSIQDQIGK